MANIFEKNKTYLGDCLELMPQMESGIFDMILCDLPYGTTACKWDTIIPFEPLWKEYERLIKPKGAIVLTASQPFTSKLIMSKIDWFRYEVIWKKSSVSNPFMAKKQILKIHENICVFYKEQPIFNPQTTKRKEENKRNNAKLKHRNRGVFGESIMTSGDGNKEWNYPNSVFETPRQTGLHPTQKPTTLFEMLIRTFTNEGELILDNCAGSGTTAEACYNTNRNYIQIEKEQKYFDLILGREKSFNKKDYEQESLFGGQM
jgi:site-specific DNA-methyltransferase (adenine-specific)